MTLSEKPAIRTYEVEVCPICGDGPNLSGNKYCYGGVDRHDKARWEWVEMVPTAQAAAYVQGVDND